MIFKSKPSVDEIVGRVGDLTLATTRQYLFVRLTMDNYSTNGYSRQYQVRADIPHWTEFPEYYLRDFRPPSRQKSREDGWTFHDPVRNEVVCLGASMIWEGEFQLPKHNKEYLFASCLTVSWDDSSFTSLNNSYLDFGHEVKTPYKIRTFSMARDVQNLCNCFEKEKILTPFSSRWERVGRKGELYYALAQRVMDSIHETIFTKEKERLCSRLNPELLLDDMSAYTLINQTIRDFAARHIRVYSDQIDELLRRDGLRAKILPYLGLEKIIVPDEVITPEKVPTEDEAVG